MKKTKIEIRGMFTSWKEVSREKARGFVNTIKEGALMPEDEVNNYINKKRLRGTTVEELEKCAK